MIKKLRQKKGFTLIELMIVVAILGVLAAVAIPQYLNYIAASKERATISNFENAKRASLGSFALSDAKPGLAKNAQGIVDELLLSNSKNPYDPAANAFTTGAVAAVNGEVALVETGTFTANNAANAPANAGTWASGATIQVSYLAASSAGTPVTETFTKE